MYWYVWLHSILRYIPILLTKNRYYRYLYMYHYDLRIPVIGMRFRSYTGIAMTGAELAYNMLLEIWLIRSMGNMRTGWRC